MDLPLKPSKMIYLTLQRELTDLIYWALFAETTLRLLLKFNLSPAELQDDQDNELRDCMGELALEALAIIENACVGDIKRYGKGRITLDMLRELVWFHACEVAIEYKARSAGLGIDLLTGLSVS